MHTNFMIRLMEANSRYVLLQDIQFDILHLRALHPRDGAIQLKMDRRQKDLDKKKAEVESEFQELAQIAALN